VLCYVPWESYESFMTNTISYYARSSERLPGIWHVSLVADPSGSDIAQTLVTRGRNGPLTLQRDVFLVALPKRLSNEETLKSRHVIIYSTPQEVQARPRTNSSVPSVQMQLDQTGNIGRCSRVLLLRIAKLLSLLH